MCCKSNPCIIRKNIIVKIYGDYLKCATPDDERITRMLHLPPKKNELISEHDIQSVKMHTAEYEIETRSVYDILDQICKDTNLYLYVKEHKSKRNSRGAFYAIHSKWFGPNHVNATAS